MSLSRNQGKNHLETVLREVKAAEAPLAVAGLAGSERAFFLARLAAAAERPVTVMVPTEAEIPPLASDIGFFLNSRKIGVQSFPGYAISPFKSLPYHGPTAAERIRTLYRLMTEPERWITVASPEAVMGRLMPRGILSETAELVMAGEEWDRDALLRRLAATGYSRATLVEEPGDFAVRGGIIDVFSPLYPEPFRLEFFGDMVESIRFFSARHQRTLESTGEVVILPAREAIVAPENLSKAVARVRSAGAAAGLSPKNLRALVDRVQKEGRLWDVEGLPSILHRETATFWDFLPENALFVRMEPAAIRSAAEAAENRLHEAAESARADEKLWLPPDQVALPWASCERRMDAAARIDLSPLPTAEALPSETETPVYHFSVEDAAGMRDELSRNRSGEFPFSPLTDWLREQRTAGRATILACAGPARADRLQSLLESHGFQPAMRDAVPDPLRPGTLALVRDTLSAGFVWPGAGISVITDAEIFGTRRKRRSQPRRGVRADLLTFEDLQPGELVVHADHGIGRYDRLVNLKVNGTAGDFLLLEYRDGDKLYLPVDRMQVLQKYMGVDGVQPHLDKMGGASWSKVKARVKESVEKIAGELLNLYAARRVHDGAAYPVESKNFQEFENGFAYEETPDQRKAIEAVLHDLNQSQPMDRLICGDVGYGKTEVALRAAFVVVNGGRQVAVLVPTTVLAEQHHETFSQRFADYPATVACLSRFRPPSEQRKILKGLADGTIDIVIGTHRLLQRDVSFAELGLIVLDEEQRFGVRHKEKLKQLRKTVDVLALTATPIPRTLHMSLTGVRDISVITTPPEQRRPIVSYLSEPDDRIIADAVRRELRRGGQAFFVHNHVQSIDRTAEHLRGLVPEARVAVAHGQMSEDALERVMLAFHNQEIDLLVCTTIIESGLDVSAANTIFINRADRFGLAQIYQLRGRVGRSEAQAYAYLFIPPESTLTRDAQKRLRVLMEHSDLGAGFQIAMSDLKIRGGGSILGANQSGHIAAVGYDMFLQLMEDAVARLKGEPVVEPLTPEITIPLSAYLPEDYIPDIDQRLTAYRRLSRMTVLSDIADFKAELIDRFGPLPTEAANLLLKIMLKILATRAGVKRLDLSADGMILHFSEAHQRNPFGLVDMISGDGNRFRMRPEGILEARMSRAGTGLLAEAKNILKEIGQRVNS
jgi:transcription-repair coupling factor (superfamily II helicase)